jgi:hypothetical protein
MIEPWNAAHFRSTDDLNQEIWRSSPGLQLSLDPPEGLSLVGSVGAQQAMLHDRSLTPSGVLPWVPDLVGVDSDDPAAVIVVGSAYAGFIQQYSGRRKSMPLANYLASGSAQEFQTAFLREVVGNDASYYGPLRRLCSSLPAPGFTSFVDLCRVSLVRRGIGSSNRTDSSSSSEIGRDAMAYVRYAENRPAANWLWHRFVHSGAKRIVALGHVAEHGLLRMFAKRGMRISERQTELTINQADNRWATKYADPGRQLSYWLDNGTWWTVRGVVDGRERAWKVLPVYHPARHSVHDSSYDKTRALIDRMWQTADSQ